MMRAASAVMMVAFLASPAWAEETIDCAAGLELTLSTIEPPQGAIILVEVRSEFPAEVKATWADQSLHFWQEGDSHLALLGVDLRRRASQLPLTVETKRSSGQEIGCSTPVTIRDGNFVVQKITVQKKFVDLSAEDLERSRRETNQLLRIFRAATAARLWEGAFQLPVKGVKGSGSFGKRRILNDQPRSPHSGEDFPAPAGTPVRAPQRGRVVMAGDLFFSGNTIVLDHGLGLYTFYGHLESMAVEHGQVVKPGEVIGRVGATGRVTGPHLHWAARINKARVNPLDLVTIVPTAKPPTE
jgi:murein DD-endopeptidase MepM/ murein hydrolase activator NlpD